MARNNKENILGGKQVTEPATPLATHTQEQAVQPQEEVKVVPIASSGVNVAPEKVNDIFEKSRDSLTEVKKDGYDGIFQQIQANNNATAKQKMAEIEEKRRNRARIFNAIGDGVAALSNLYFASQGAPSVEYDPRGSLSARAQERWDKMDLLRNQEEQKQYMRDKQQRELELRQAQQARREARLARQEARQAERDKKEDEHREKQLKQQKELAELRAKTDANNWVNRLTQQEAKDAASYRKEVYRQEQLNARAQAKGNNSKENKNEVIVQEFDNLPYDIKQKAKEDYGIYGDKDLSINQMKEVLTKHNARNTQASTDTQGKKSLSTYSKGAGNTKKQVKNF